VSIDASLFPDLAAERAHLTRARACRDAMVSRLERVDPEAAADEITKEYVEVTVAEALEDLRAPGAGDFFGRIDEERGPSWYIGRRHIEDAAHDPVVVDWRAPIAAPFYRATVHDPLGVRLRRRFTLADGELTAYLDEHLDDPTTADVAAGVPDPVLAEIGAARTGAMREIVATIQAEQDVVIRAPLDGCLAVQGGPGTGKTAVGLHRAAYLLFEHRRHLARHGVLVVGPNEVFLEYIAHVLPSLGERSVQQRTVQGLAVPKVPVQREDAEALARLKGDERFLQVVERAVLAEVRPPPDAVRIPVGARSIVVRAEEMAAWFAVALAGSGPLVRRRGALRVLAQEELRRRSGRDDIWTHAGPLREALQRAWPTPRAATVVGRLLDRPHELREVAAGLLADEEVDLVASAAGRRRRWTAADQLLVDEAHCLITGPPSTFGHVVVDEAQDHSAVALRVIGRRAASGSFTLLGDLAQSTTPAGQRSWADVQRHLGVAKAPPAELTIGYRVPAPVLDVANRLLPLTGVDVAPSRSVRVAGEAPAVRRAAAGELAVAVAEEALSVRHRHPLTGVIVPPARRDEVAAALAAAGLVPIERVQPGSSHEIPLFGAEAVKGLEFDGVVVVNPHEILDGTPRGARLLYVAMTRAVQTLHCVTDAPLPAVLRDA
jgi:DNA helicase IV